jgi:hypothetical protein
VSPSSVLGGGVGNCWLGSSYGSFNCCFGGIELVCGCKSIDAHLVTSTYFWPTNFHQAVRSGFVGLILAGAIGTVITFNLVMVVLRVINWLWDMFLG